MRTLRKYLFWLFAITFLVCLGIALSNLLVTLRRQPGPLVLRYFLVPAVFSVLAAVFAMAAWAGLTGKLSARWWGLAASVVYILVAGGVFRLRFSSSDFLVLGIGLAGLFAFARPYEQPTAAARAQEGRRIPGDGTSTFINKISESLIFLLGLVAYFWWLQWLRVRRIPIDDLGWRTAVLALVVLVITALHELAHTTAGLGLGMKLRAFLVGPLEWRISDGRWRFQFKLEKILSADGATGVVPPTRDYPRWKRLCMLAAGPFVNLLTGGLALWIALTANRELPLQFEGVAALFGAWSLVLGSINLLPFRHKDSYSDGAILYQLLAGGPWGDFHQVTATVGTSQVTPLRPRDYDIQAILRAAQTITQGRPGLILQLSAYTYFLDQRKLTEAGEALEKAAAVLHFSALEIPAELYSVFVFGNAYLRRDAATAREWWMRMEARKPVRFNVDYWRARSALHWMEGDLKAANEAWDQAYTLAQQLPQAGAYEFDRYCCALLRKALDETSAEAAAHAAQGGTSGEPA